MLLLPYAGEHLTVPDKLNDFRETRSGVRGLPA